MKQLIKSIVLSLVLLSITSVNASTIIDSFNDVDGFGNPIFQSVVDSGSDTLATTSAIGGYRTIGIEKSGLLGAKAVVIGGATGVYTHSADAMTSATSTITWDANGAGLNANLLTADVADFNDSTCYECFVLDILSIDQGNVDLTIGLDDGNTAYSVTSTGVGTGIYEVLFSEFIGVDFAMIQSISLEVAGGVESDLTLDFQGYTGVAGVSGVASVPSPATVWLLVSGLISFVGWNRKHLI